MAHNHNHSCNSHNHDHCHNHESGNNMQNFLRPALSAVMLAAGMIMAHCGVSFFNSHAVELIWYIIAFLPVGLPVVKEAAEELHTGDFFNEFTLMVIACIGAFCIGEYPEAVGVMLFYSIGETLQDGAVDRATRNISRLLDVRGEKATIIVNGIESVVKPEQVNPGDTLIIRPGERVTLDGELMDDSATFDTSALTGESMPRELHRGDEVLAGMISSQSTVKIRVTRPYSDSALSRILEMVRNARSRKASAEQFISKFARIYTPTVVALAALLVAAPAAISLFDSGFDYHFSEWLYRALVFLVISCPCALVISVPLGYYAGIGAASRAGILFKGGNYLEAITHINAVAFDKTGTLTTGHFTVVKTVAESIDPNTMLALLAAAESHSSHPLARTICEYVKSLGITIPEAESMEEVAGKGVKAKVNGKMILAGNMRLLQTENISYSTGEAAAGDTVIYCVIDSQPSGYVIMSDTLKPDSAEAVSDLKSLGISEIIMLSGDKQSIADDFGRRLGITEVHGDLLPQDKAEFVASYSSKPGKKIAFTGDGMNDAPVLSLSDVGIAMGGLGSDAAIESADVVIQTDSPSKVATAIRIGRSTHTIVMENIIGAISIKVIVLVLGAAGYASLWAAVFADVGVALLAVLNSMRILWKKY